MEYQLISNKGHQQKQARGVFCKKKLLLKISQHSQENTEGVKGWNFIRKRFRFLSLWGERPEIDLTFQK